MIFPHWKPQNGWIVACGYCGEQVGNSVKYCKTCKTQPGRKEIFDANVAIAKENLKKGFKVPEFFRNWK